MEDILEVYMRPHDPNKPLICMDETTKQLTIEKHKTVPAVPGKPARFDCEYKRNGVSNLFMFYEPFGGKRYVSIADRRTKIDWAFQIRELLDIHYPHVRKVILVMDNLNTHKGASLYEAFPPKEARRLLNRLEIHYTPKHGSWLNIAEIETEGPIRTMPQSQNFGQAKTAARNPPMADATQFPQLQSGLAILDR